MARCHAASEVALELDGLFASFAHPRVPVEFDVFQLLRGEEENGDVVGRGEGVDVVADEGGEVREWRHGGCRSRYPSGWKAENKCSQGRLLEQTLVNGLERLGVELPTVRISSGSIPRLRAGTYAKVVRFFILSRAARMAT